MDRREFNMRVYVGLVSLGVVAVGISAYMPILVQGKTNPVVSFLITVFSFIFPLLITFIVTQRWMEEKFEKVADKLKEESDERIRRLKKEYDTTTLEKTIRDGTRTLIKNALDYFKIENIKNEIGASAAIQNLQLDKYGQIIELLADFSMILPDVKENKEIVEEEITHQITIYEIDEKPFSTFLQRIMDKYVITVDKKIKEKTELDSVENMKICPQCAEKVLPKAKVCKHCGYSFETLNTVNPHKNIPLEHLEKGKQLYSVGEYQRALEEFTIAIELKSDYAMAYYARSLVNSKLNKAGEAEVDLKEAAYLGHKKAQELLNAKGSQ